MKSVLIYSGTTEGRTLAELLAKSKIPSIVSVATEYGEIVMEDNAYITVRTGRLDVAEMSDMLKNENILAVVDATHPFATNVTANIKESMTNYDIPYFRLSRNVQHKNGNEEQVYYFDDIEGCAEKLCNQMGNILLTTGSKDLKKFTERKELIDRIYARVLPSLESLRICEDSGICGKHIIAMQGPFSIEMNVAMIKQYNIQALVTKDSGKIGGVDEKIEAANIAGISTYIIGNTVIDDGLCFDEVVDALQNITGARIEKSKLNIVLLGKGMGNNASLTVEAKRYIDDADYIIGAERLIKECNPKKEKKAIYLAKDIIPYVKDIEKKEYDGANIAIIFSGDSGFYSGCKKVYDELIKEYSNVSILPGISTINYLSASFSVPWQDANIISFHGVKDNFDIQKNIQSIMENYKTFALLSGKEQLLEICDLLCNMNYEGMKILIGYQLSYADEELFEITADMCSTIMDENIKDGLFAAIFINERPVQRILSPTLKDEDFIRDKVPMTKEEIRALSICKLQMKDNSVFWDIGAGTGSISVQVAKLSPYSKVYAIECKEEAVELIEKNCIKHGCYNVNVVKSKAPEGLSSLPSPDQVFIGGSKGNLKGILQTIYSMNDNARVVINAISMETINEIYQIPNEFSVKDYEVCMVQVSKNKTVGSYNLMQGENPVFICSFDFI